MQRNGAHKFTLKAGVGKPLDTNTVTDLYRRILRVVSNGDDLTNTFVATNEGTMDGSAHVNNRG